MKSDIAEIIKAFFGTLGFLFVLLPITFIGIPYKIISSPNHTHFINIGTFRYFGLVPIVVGGIIYFWCSLSFVFSGKGTPIYSMPPKKLVVKGLYRFVRNPMYIAGLLVLAGEVLLFQSRDVFIYLLAMFGVFNFFVLGREEPRLEKRFGESYRRYRKSVRRWIPRLTPYQENDSVSQYITSFQNP